MDRYFNYLFEEYDFDHTKDKSYGENLSNSLDYIVQYNQNRLDDVYDARATAYRTQLDPSSINDSLTNNGDGTYKWNIPRDQYDNNSSRTYRLFFQDGILADWNDNIKETTNDLEITLDSKLDTSSKLESIDFKNMSNFLLPLNYIPRADMHVDSDINCTLITGNVFNHYFQSFMSIKEYLNNYFTSTIDIPYGYDYIEANNPLEDDLFTASIIVRLDMYQDLFGATLEISEEPHGDEVDLDHFNMIREFSSTIYVKSV
jgi:hypothetical protein